MLFYLSTDDRRRRLLPSQEGGTIAGRTSPIRPADSSPESPLSASMLEYLLKFIAVGSFAIGVVAVYFTVHNNTRQLNAQIFLAYSDRVRAIRALTANHAVSPGDTAATMFLIFEFFELKRRGFVARSTWSIWDQDIIDLLRSEAFRAQWDEIRPRFKNHPHFLQWVDGHVR
jgi:hypothetical protein